MTHELPSRQTVSAVILAAVSAAFVASLASVRAAPAVFDILFGLMPALALAAALVLAAHRRLALSEDAAFVTARGVVWSSAIVAAFATMLGLWDNPSAILLPRHAVFSMLTLGIWPSHEGPVAAVRFLPVIVFVGVFLPARRAGLDEVRSALVALVTALVQALSAHVLTWATWAVHLAGSGDVLDNVQDAFRIFVASNVDGYWANAQSQRFFATVGGQAETGMQAVQGAATLMLAFAVLATRVPWSRLIALWRERMGIAGHRRLGLVLSGVLLGLSAVRPSGSLADLLACALFLTGAVAWSLVWAAGDDEAVSGIWPVVALAASALLGWPVILGWVVADAMRRQAIGVRSLWGVAVLEGVSGLALVWTGLAFGLREMAVGTWMVPSMVAMACVATGAWLGTKLLRSSLAPSWQVGYVIGLAAVSSLISGQIWSVLPFGITTAATLGLHDRGAAWDTWKVRLLDGYLVFYLLMLLVAPRLLAG